MAENVSGPPPSNEVSELPHTPESPYKKQGFRGFIEGLRRIASPNTFGIEKDDDDEDEEKLTPREKRTGSLIGRIFGAILRKEEVPAEPSDGPERSSIFFGVGTVESGEPANHEVNEPIEKVESEPEPETKIVPEEKESDAYEGELSIAHEISIEEATPEPDLSSTVEGLVFEDIEIEEPKEAAPPDTPSPEVITYRQRHMRPETAVMFGAYEHHRVNRLNEQVEVNTPEKKEPTVEHQRIEVKKTEVRPKTPERRTVATETTKEQQREAVEKAVERHDIKMTEEKKREVIEKILAAPEFKGALDTEMHKEISYELSHEHKDLDKQSQMAWAALQAAAEKTTKANLEALAHAEDQIPTAIEGDALREAEALKALEQKSLYKKAAISGVVTAVVIIAVLLLILLMEKK